MKDNTNPRYSPDIAQRDWMVIAQDLRQAIRRTQLKIDEEIRADADLFVTADGLEKLAHAAMWACNLEMLAATFADKTKREGGYG